MHQILVHKAVCYVGYLIGDSSSIVIDSKDWQWVLGLGIVRVVPMVVVALLEKGMVSGLMKEHRGRVPKRHTDLLLDFTLPRTIKCQSGIIVP